MTHTTAAFLLALLTGLVAGIGLVPNKGFVWTDVDDPQGPPRSIVVVDDEASIRR